MKEYTAVTNTLQYHTIVMCPWQRVIISQVNKGYNTNLEAQSKPEIAA
jgi:hypothetical protein